MLKNIVFDMGNVIIEWNPKNLSKKIAGDLSWVLETYLFETDVWVKLDAGSVSLEEGLEEILSYTPAKYHQLITHAFYHWGEYITIFENTERLIKKLKEKGYRVFMLSNCSVSFDDYHTLYPVFSEFESRYVSAHHQLMKPHKEIYLNFLEENHLIAQECLFIDDVQKNVLGARSVGMQAYHFTGDTSELEEMLL